MIALTRSYVHGSQRHSADRRDHRRASSTRPSRRWADREALIVRHQNVRWTYGELKEQVDAFAAGLAGARASSQATASASGRRTTPNGSHAIRHRQGRADPGQHQSGLSPGRARIRAEQSGLPRADHCRAVQDQRLSRHAARAGAGIDHCAPGELHAAQLPTLAHCSSASATSACRAC